MSCCGHCEDAGDLFNARAARRDLRRYRARGPSATTRLLLDALLAVRGPGDRALLDVGGGVGAISHELLQAGFEGAVQVDASTAYLAASGKEAARRGHRERISFHFGDFVDLADALAPADVVTLDRVLCCYPDVERLVSASVEKARHLYGLVYPRERALTRAGVSLANAWFRVRRSEFRTFVHSPEQVERIIRERGFRRASLRETPIWRVETWVRE